MSLVEAKCTNCGSILKVDNEKEAAICEFCGSAFIVEKAINYNSIVANVVNIYNSNESIDIKPTKKEYSENEIISIIEEAGYNRLLSPDFLITAIDYANEYGRPLIKDKINNYCQYINFAFNFDYINDYINAYIEYDTISGYYKFYKLNAIWENAGKENDFREDANNFIGWIDFDTNYLMNNYNVLTLLQEKITKYYIELVKDGIMDAEFESSSVDYTVMLWGVRASRNGIFKDIKTKLKNKYLYEAFEEGLATVSNFGPDRSEYLFCLGKYDIKWDSEYSTYTVHSYGYYLNEKKYRKKNHLCQYCGSSFKGLFSKVCSNCGKPKDY